MINFKNKKKFLCIILCILLSFLLTSCSLMDSNKEPTTLSPLEIMESSVLQYPDKNEEFRYIIYDKYIAISEYIGPGGNVVVPEKINDLPVYAITDEAFREFSEYELTVYEEYTQDGRITSVKLPESIITIGKSAFLNCESLKTINIPSSVNSIGDFCFSGCVNLEKVEILDGVTTIGEEAFSLTSSLREIILPESVISVGMSCFEKSGIISLSLPSSLLTIPTSLCNECEYLTNVKISEPPHNTNSEGDTVPQPRVIQNYAFAKCKMLTNVWLPGNFTEISEYAFMDSLDNLWFYSYTQSTAAVYASTFRIDFKLVTEKDFIDIYNDAAEKTKKEIEEQNKVENSTENSTEEVKTEITQ